MADPVEVSTPASWVIPSIVAVSPVDGVPIEDLGWGLVWVMSALTLFVLGSAGFLAWISWKVPRQK